MKGCSLLRSSAALGDRLKQNLLGAAYMGADGVRYWSLPDSPACDKPDYPLIAPISKPFTARSPKNRPMSWAQACLTGVGLPDPG